MDIPVLYTLSEGVHTVLEIPRLFSILFLTTQLIFHRLYQLGNDISRHLLE